MLKKIIFKLIKTAVIKSGLSKKDNKNLFQKISIFYPKIKEQGDYSTNVAFIIAALNCNSPRFVAKKIVAILNQEKRSKKIFEKIEVADKGFINFFISKSYLQNQFLKILKNPRKFCYLNIGRKKKVQVEFISANPTGPLTIGNGRGGFLGDVLANVFKRVGYRVVKEYYINDIGRQITILGASVISFLGLKKNFVVKYFPLVIQYKNKDELYKGNYIRDLAKEFKKDFNNNYQKLILKKGLGGIGEWAAKKILAKNKKIIKEKMGIKFDRFFSEKRDLKDRDYNQIFQLLKRKNLIRLKEGAVWLRIDDSEKVLIRSENLSENVRKIKLEKGKKAKNCSITYLFSDLVYHLNKFKTRKFDLVIDILGADHYGYSIFLKKSLGKFFSSKDKLKIIITQLVRLVKKGKEIKMSKRRGEFITLKELIDQVGLDSARFFFLMYSPDTHMDFDLDLAKERSEKNPVYYVQYAYVRANNILKKSNIKTYKIKNARHLNLLNNELELNLILKILKFPELLEEISKNYQVHDLVRYILDLSADFHRFYKFLSVLNAKTKDLMMARLSLVFVFRAVLKNIFDILGISAPQKM